MIGIGCFGDEHEKRVRGIIERLTPEVYLLLLQARGIASNQADEDSNYGKDLSIINSFIDNIDKVMGQTRLPNEDGDKKVIYFDITYTDKNGDKV